MRNTDIINTLKYVESRRQELFNLMFDAKMQGISIENVANLVADILNNLTKCFDYCANDIYDKYIAPRLRRKKMKTRVYFPFYKNQLSDRKSLFNLLLRYETDVHNSLLEIAEKSENKEMIANTTIPYSIAREVRNLVNSDKHDKIIEVDNQGRRELLAKSKIGNIVISEDQLNQNGWRVEVFPGQDKKTVIAKSYRLVENNQEVVDYCSLALWNTQQILDVIYKNFFGTKIIVS